jgi:hypothetical protein
MVNGKIIPIVSKHTLEAVKILEESGILVKEEYLHDNIRRVDLDTLFELSADGYRGGFDAALVSVLHGYIKTKGLLTDPYITIEATGKEEPEPNYPGCGSAHRKKDAVVNKCPDCGKTVNISHNPEHVWVISGLYSYEVVRTISCCHNCWWSNRSEIEAEERARIDSGDKTGWGTRL